MQLALVNHYFGQKPELCDAIFARELHSEREDTERALRTYFEPLAESFIDALQTLLPHANRTQVGWCYEFAARRCGAGSARAGADGEQRQVLLAASNTSASRLACGELAQECRELLKCGARLCLG